MKLNALTSLAQVAVFLAATQPVTFFVFSTKDDCYQWIQANLLRFGYLTALEVRQRARLPLSGKGEGILGSTSHGSFTNIARLGA